MSIRLTVTRTEERTAVLRRVWFASDDLTDFADSTDTDRYVKLVFPKPGVEYPDGLDMKVIRRTMPAEDLPVVRTYTALRPEIGDDGRGTLAIDFVVHGDEGVAGPWAAAARPGDELLVNGPGGAYAPDLDADWHLLVADEAGLPAVTAALEQLVAVAPDAVAVVVGRVAHEGDEPDLPTTSNTEVTWVHGEPGALGPAVRALEWRPGRVHAFVHGEAHEVMHELRPHLLKERGIPRADLSISGYWRAGRTEEGFRDWKADLRRTEGE